MKKEEREIDGYKAPYDLFGSKIKKGLIFRVIESYFIDYYIPFYENGEQIHYDYRLPKEIVEQWEPVYKEEYEIGEYYYGIKLDIEDKYEKKF